MELYYIGHMNDGSYVNMIIKNYNSEEVYSMEELEKSKQKSANHEDEEVCCCGHHHHEEHDEHEEHEHHHHHEDDDDNNEHCGCGHHHHHEDDDNDEHCGCGHHHHHEHGEDQDAHARAHVNDIKRRFDGREVTNWQILLFGLTGGLIPCPAAITVLLICIQLKALTLGATLVVSFSIGLALTLVTVGVGAAISVQQVAKRWSGFNTLAKRAPYFSSLLIGLVGVYMGVHGFMGIMR